MGVRDWAQAASFALRRTLRWTRGAPIAPHEDKSDLFIRHPEPDSASRFEQRVRAQYDLQTLYETSRNADYCDNLLIIASLERLNPSLPDNVVAVDVGSKNFSYAFGLYRFFERSGKSRRAVSLEGIEIDGYGIYPDFRSRADWAQMYVSQLGSPHVSYRVEDFLIAESRNANVVTMFFPFVKSETALRWGLPSSVCKPGEIFARCFETLVPGGLLITFHQTHEESALAKELVRGAGFQLEQEHSLASKLVEYHEQTEDRVGLVARKPA